MLLLLRVMLEMCLLLLLLHKHGMLLRVLSRILRMVAILSVLRVQMLLLWLWLLLLLVLECIVLLGMDNNIRWHLIRATLLLHVQRQGWRSAVHRRLLMWRRRCVHSSLEGRMLHLWSDRLRLRGHGQLIASVISNNRKHILFLILVLDIGSVEEFFVGVGLARIVVLTKREREREGQGVLVSRTVRKGYQKLFPSAISGHT